MIPILRRRAGVPRFTRLLRNGEPATIVAFGTSLTLAGRYLERMPAALTNAHPNARFTAINAGRNGYNTLSAVFRVSADVTPHAPDLVLIEFAHNDVSDDLVAFIPAALEGMIAEIRSVRPACEFIFVYLALAGRAVGGPTPAMLAYEDVAEYHGIPSIDLAGLSELLVATGRAVWRGEGLPELTDDGVHHGPAAAALLGEPFAGAFVQLLGTSDAPAQLRAPRSTAFASIGRVRAADRLSAGVWAVRPLAAHEIRGAGIDEEGLSEAVEPGATVRVAFTGTNAFAWVSGSGVLGIRIVETDERYRVGIESAAKWTWCSLIETHARAHYTLEVIALNAGLMIGDLSFTGPVA